MVAFAMGMRCLFLTSIIKRAFPAMLQCATSHVVNKSIRTYQSHGDISNHSVWPRFSMSKTHFSKGRRNFAVESAPVKGRRRFSFMSEKIILVIIKL